VEIPQLADFASAYVSSVDDDDTQALIKTPFAPKMSNRAEHHRAC
jgi:hypothetical protein